MIMNIIALVVCVIVMMVISWQEWFSRRKASHGHSNLIKLYIHVYLVFDKAMIIMIRED